jgi:hypothetical protein
VKSKQLDHEVSPCGVPQLGHNFIFMNQIKAQRDQKIIVWVEYFPYKYSFKVISND